MPYSRIIRLPFTALMNRFKFIDCMPVFRYWLWLFFFLCIQAQTNAQCPPNLGFESGDFTNWSCFAGKTDTSTGTRTIKPSLPINGKHTIFKRTDSVVRDPFGKFPVLCPNGSNYSIRLGNEKNGGEIDRVVYTLTVPADKQIYSIIYNYAVVFENPDHLDYQQPRFTAKVFDPATNDYISCSSFDYTASANLPGFKLSPVSNERSTVIYYKNWSPVTIKLVGYAGKTLQIEFTAYDCTLDGHFGYAYLDINEDCTSPIQGSTVCLGAESTLLVAPFGFKDYRWYNADFTQQKGTGISLPLKPIPPLNTVYALEVRPFPGSGCVDTLYATIKQAPVPFVFKVMDSIQTCPPLTVDLTAPRVTAGSTPGLRFSYFMDPDFNEYVSVPYAVDTTGIYYIKAINDEGCLDLKHTIIKFDSVPVFGVKDPPVYYYPTLADITSPEMLVDAQPDLIYSYWKDASATIPVINPQAVNAEGIYYIKGSTKGGCELIKPLTVTMQIPPPPNIFSPNNDGIHDTWIITGLNNYPNCNVSIYDRTGRPVYQSTGYHTPWDGRINGKPLPLGTYYYVIKASDRLRPFTGSVTLIK